MTKYQVIAWLFLIFILTGCTTTTYERGDVKITHSTPMIFGKQFGKLDIQRIGDDATLTIENYNAKGAEELAVLIAAYLKARGI